MVGVPLRATPIGNLNSRPTAGTLCIIWVPSIVLPWLIPSVRGEHGGRDPNVQGIAGVFGDGDGFVEVAKEAFNTDGSKISLEAGCNRTWRVEHMAVNSLR